MTKVETREDLMERGLVGEEQDITDLGPSYSTELASPTTSTTLTQVQSEKGNLNTGE